MCGCLRTWTTQVHFLISSVLTCRSHTNLKNVVSLRHLCQIAPFVCSYLQILDRIIAAAICMRVCNSSMVMVLLTCCIFLIKVGNQTVPLWQDHQVVGCRPSSLTARCHTNGASVYRKFGGGVGHLGTGCREDILYPTKLLCGNGMQLPIVIELRQPNEESWVLEEWFFVALRVI